MITIKIKTWKDYKKDFINWVQAPRRKTCKEYVRYMESVSQQLVGERLAKELDKIEGLSEAQKVNIICTAQQAIVDCKNDTCQLINECEPQKLLWRPTPHHMKKINYSSRSLRHIISSAILIVMLLIFVAGLIIPASVMITLLTVLFIIGAITVLYFSFLLIVDTYLDELEDHKHEE